MKKMKFLIQAALMLAVFVSCQKDKETSLEIKLDKQEYIFPSNGGDVVMVAQVIPANLQLSTANTSVGMTSVVGMPPSLKSIEKGDKEGQWLITISCTNGVGDCSVSVKTDNAYGNAVCKLKKDDNRFGLEGMVVYYNDPADWEKSLEFNVTPAYQKFGGNMPSSTLHFHAPNGDIWGESTDKEAFCIILPLIGNEGSINMIIDETDQKRLFSGKWYVEITGKINDIDAVIEVPVILKKKY